MVHLYGIGGESLVYIPEGVTLTFLGLGQEDPIAGLDGCVALRLEPLGYFTLFHRDAVLFGLLNAGL